MNCHINDLLPSEEGWLLQWMVRLSNQHSLTQHHTDASSMLAPGKTQQRLTALLADTAKGTDVCLDLQD
jgi:hypothetical protein